MLKLIEGFIGIVIKKINNQNVSNKLSLEQTRQTSLDALKMVYYVIIGLAITEALSKALLDQKGNFLGGEIFMGDNLISFFLLLAFLFTIVRFIHGASIYLEMDKNLKTKWKLLWDFAGFVLHGAFFYLMAVSLKDVSTFLVSFGLMLLVDALWIILIGWKGYIKLEGTPLKWLISDFVIIVLLCGVWVISRTMTYVWPAVAILIIIAIGGAYADYSWNKRFYFPIET